MEDRFGFAPVQPKNGTVTIPAQVRRRFGLDQPGAQVEIIVRRDEIVLVPHVAVRSDHARFLTHARQAIEHVTETDLDAGDVSTLETSGGHLAHLERVDRPSPSAPSDRTLVTLREAIELGILKTTLAGARKSAQRLGFPEPVGLRGGAKVYDQTELEMWHGRRAPI